MNFSLTTTIQVTAFLLLSLAVTQGVYTLLYVAQVDVPRGIIWGIEGVLFTFLTAFACAAMVQAKNYHVAWSAIAVSSVFNLVQVSIGLTMFGPFGEVAKEVEGLAPAASAVVALSFMIYYAAKILLGFAAVILGMAKLEQGSKALGGVTAAIGGIALLANSILVVFGREGFLPSPVAGASGVMATILLALCLLTMIHQDRVSGD